MRRITRAGMAGILAVTIGIGGFAATSVADPGHGGGMMGRHGDMDDGARTIGPGMGYGGRMGPGMGYGMMGPGMGFGYGMGYGGRMMEPGMGYGMMGPGMGYGGRMMGPGMGYGMMGPGMGYGMMGPRMGFGMMGPWMMRPRMMGPRMGYGMMGPGMVGPWARVRPLNLGEDDVKAFFDRMLAIWGNKRLKLGKVVKKDENTILADIVTVDNSLVERYAVDRRTGFMRPVE